MVETTVNLRRIDKLKQLALELGFSNVDAKEFGKLSKTATWESLLSFYGVSTESYLRACESPDTTELLPFELPEYRTVSNSPAKSLDTADHWTNDGSFPVSYIDTKSLAAGFFAWVDPLQLLACFFISIGLFVLLFSVLPNPLKFVPSCIRINIQIGE